MSWIAILPQSVPEWRGPTCIYRPLDRPAAAPQPRVAREPWQHSKPRTPRWRPWALIVPGTNDPEWPEAWPWKLLRAKTHGDLG